jgi:formylglycine-generating enzyme required for sulfatase activity
MSFRQVAADYAKLKAQFNAGALSQADFEERLKELEIQDEQGRWWSIGYETGQWYVHENGQWVAADPPSDPADLVSTTTARPTRRLPLVLAITGAVALVAAIVAAVIFWPKTKLGIGSAMISPVDDMAMVYVPAGKFAMGAAPDSAGKVPTSEGPEHEVSLPAFWIDRTEVTNAMFARFVSQAGYTPQAKAHYVFDFAKGEWALTAGADWQHPRGPDSSIKGLEQHPVIQVFWEDAKAYCTWAGRRLPTEAEWEKAARGVDSRRYPWGSERVSATRLNFADVNVSELSWARLTEDDGYRFTAPVGSYPDGASPYGALDMVGNAWEWVSDFFNEAYYQRSPAKNPQGPDTGEQRVIRGGSWLGDYADVRASARRSTSPYTASDELGFRCALSAPR